MPCMVSCISLLSHSSFFFKQVVGHNGAECKSLILPARWLLSQEKVGEHTCASLYTEPTLANCTTSVDKKSGM